MAAEEVTCWRVDYLTCYWSDMYNASLPVPEGEWRTAVDYFGDQINAFQYAARQAAASKQVYAVVKMTSHRVIVLDGVHMAKPDLSDLS